MQKEGAHGHRFPIAQRQKLKKKKKKKKEKEKRKGLTEGGSPWSSVPNTYTAHGGWPNVSKGSPPFSTATHWYEIYLLFRNVEVNMYVLQMYY